MRSALRRWLLWGGMGLIGGVAAALLVAWSGIFNIAASAGHPHWLEAFLAMAMRRSVQVNSGDTSQAFLDNDLLPLGAAHFHGNCAICHGAPGQPVNPTFSHMLPKPPPLQENASRWRVRELFWIGYHGLQFTGMPGWSGAGREDEMWAVATLLRELPAMDVDTYQSLASGNTYMDAPDATTLVSRGMNIFPINTCDRCHGTADAPAVSPHVPRLGGQSRAYLLRALREYRSNRRQSGFMEPVAVALLDGHLEALADYYAALAEPPHPHKPVGDTELGQRLAYLGDPARDVPACLSCHGQPKRADVPVLAGQAAPYIKQQLALWRSGGRQQTSYGQLMGRVAKRLTDAQVDAVAAYFAGLPLRDGVAEVPR